MLQFVQHHIVLFAVILGRLLFMPLCHIGWHHLVHCASHRITHHLSHYHKLFRFVPDSIMLISLVAYDYFAESTHSTE
jgi:hypothetical protein